MNREVKPSTFTKVYNEREQFRNNLFEQGLAIFYAEACERNPTNWIYCMVNHHGDRIACEEFVKAGGYAHMTVTEIMEVAAGNVPEWAAKILAKFERENNIRL